MRHLSVNLYWYTRTQWLVTVSFCWASECEAVTIPYLLHKDLVTVTVFVRHLSVKLSLLNICYTRTQQLVTIWQFCIRLPLICYHPVSIHKEQGHTTADLYQRSPLYGRGPAFLSPAGKRETKQNKQTNKTVTTAESRNADRRSFFSLQ